MRDVSQLEFFHFNTDFPGRHLLQCEKAFQLWRDVWEDTFRELEVDRPCYSDDFLHKELGGLFLDGEPVGFMLYQFLDLSRPSHLKKSYFHNYSATLYDHQVKKSGRVMVITYMTLKPEWRKAHTDLPISELLMGFAVLRFLNSNAERLIGYFRNNRRTNEMFYRHGGIPIKQLEQAYNVEVDFAEITRKSARLSTHEECALMTRQMWSTFYQQKGVNNELNGQVAERNPEAFKDTFGDALGQSGIL